MRKRRWNDTAELAALMRERAARGHNITLSPETALVVARLIAPSEPPPIRDPGQRFRVDLYAVGSTIYRLDSTGEILQIDAWARNSRVANAAFEALCERYPNESFSQRRRSWVEGERIVEQRKETLNP